MTAKALRVLVVDDSAVMRQVTSQVLSRDRAIEVVLAADPLIAMEKMARARPDVILLDLQMPRMDGLTFLRHLMATDPLPVVICSGLAGRGSREALLALEAGAVDVVEKPQIGVRAFVEESALALIDTLRGAAEAGHALRSRRRAPSSASLLPPSLLAKPWPAGSGGASQPPAQLSLAERSRLIAIGASTGGTEAIAAVLEQLLPDCPPVVIAQHMPAGFTAAFARRLDSCCRIEVKEAEDGEPLVRGRALIAPGGRHLSLRRAPSGLCAEVTDGPLVSRHRPSVDVLLRSAAACAGSGATGVLLTGMGEDGARGLKAIRDAGGMTIAQDEATCVVYGMPRAAVELGAACAVLPLHEIAGALCSPAP